MVWSSGSPCGLHSHPGKVALLPQSNSAHPNSPLPLLWQYLSRVWGSALPYRWWRWMFWCFTWSPLTIARLHCRSVVLFSFLLLSSDQSPSFLLGLLVYHPGRVLRFLVITWSLHLAFACKGEGAATVFFCSSRTSIWSIMLLSTKFLSC